MKGLFPESELRRNASADKPWLRGDTDKMLNLYFSGAHPNRIAQELNRNPKAVKRALEQFTYNERDRAVRYEPVQRYSRKGKRLTENENLMIASFLERKQPMEALAKVLQRDLSEIYKDPKAHVERSKDLVIASGVDLCLAYRCLRDFFLYPIISPQTLKDMEQEEMEFGAGSVILAKKSGKTVDDIPLRVRTLAFYLRQRHEDELSGEERF